MALRLTRRTRDCAGATGKGWSTLPDAEVSGSGLRVRASGRKEARLG